MKDHSQGVPDRPQQTTGHATPGVNDIPARPAFVVRHPSTLPARRPSRMEAAQMRSALDPLSALGASALGAHTDGSPATPDRQQVGQPSEEARKYMPGEKPQHTAPDRLRGPLEPHEKEAFAREMIGKAGDSVVLVAMGPDGALRAGPNNGRVRYELSRFKDTETARQAAAGPIEDVPVEVVSISYATTKTTEMRTERDTQRNRFGIAREVDVQREVEVEVPKLHQDADGRKRPVLQIAYGFEPTVSGAGNTYLEAQGRTASAPAYREVGGQRSGGYARMVLELPWFDAAEVYKQIVRGNPDIMRTLLDKAVEQYADEATKDSWHNGIPPYNNPGRPPYADLPRSWSLWVFDGVSKNRQTIAPPPPEGQTPSFEQQYALRRIAMPPAE